MMNDQAHGDSSQSTVKPNQSWILRILFKLLSPSTYLPNAWIQLMYTSAGRLGLLSVLFVTVLWAAAFLYVTFYYQFIPVMSHRHAINLQFDTRCNQDTCAQPSANLSLLNRRYGRVFAKGQAYRIAVGLHLPESEVNWQQGTFMVKLRLISSNGEQVAERARSGMLKYKSPIVRAITDLVCWPFMLIGLNDGSQHIKVPLFDDYYDNSNAHGEALTAQISIEARKIQIYSAELQIDAVLSGIRYYMVYWPVSSSLIGITLISSFLAVLALCTFQNLLFVQQNPIEVKEEEMITKDKEMTTKDKDLFESSKVSVKQEKDKND